MNGARRQSRRSQGLAAEERAKIWDQRWGNIFALQLVEHYNMICHKG